MDANDAESRKRLDQFVDAAFGFAVTLLVISGADAPQTLADLQRALLNIPACAAAFVLLVMFWRAHKVFARLTPNRDRWTLLLSLAIVFTVLVYVYPLRLLMQSMFYWISGGRLPGEELITGFDALATLYQIYGVGFAVLSALYAALFARTMRLTQAAQELDDARSWRDAWIVCASSGVLSGLLALLPLYQAPWLPPMAYPLIPLAIQLRERQVVRARRPKHTPAPEPET